jgi:hypothetical protein
MASEADMNLSSLSDPESPPEHLKDPFASDQQDERSWPFHAIAQSESDENEDGGIGEEEDKEENGDGADGEEEEGSEDGGNEDGGDEDGGEQDEDEDA